MKSAIALAINENEYQALIRILDGLKSGKFVHGRDRDGERPGFNMGSFHCGTAGCIGGWVGVLISGGFLGGKAMEMMEGCVHVYAANQSPGLYDLFYPTVETNYSNITIDDAALAIENFLNTGEPNWRVILDEPEEPFIEDWTDEEGHDDF